MYLITGCSSGLGLEVSKLLIESGKYVFGISRTIEESTGLLGKKNFVHICRDLTTNNDFSVLPRILKEYSSERVTVIINAALFRYEVSPIAEEESKRLFNINYFNSVKLVNSLISEELLERVLFVNSVSGLVGQSNQSQYVASKHALQGFADSLAKESVGKFFDVMTVNPGGINTPLWRDVDQVSGDVVSKFLDPAALASVLVGLLTLPPNSYVRSMVVLPESDL